MKNIYLIERHQGDHDDYRVTPVKAFECVLEATVFVNLCNLDIKLMLDKMEVYNKKYGIGIHGFQNKFENATDMMDDKEFKIWLDKHDKEYNEILETFKHDDLEFADTPIVYEIRKIELVKKDY